MSINSLKISKIFLKLNYVKKMSNNWQHFQVPNLLFEYLLILKIV